MHYHGAIKFKKSLRMLPNASITFAGKRIKTFPQILHKTCFIKLYIAHSCLSANEFLARSYLLNVNGVLYFDFIHKDEMLVEVYLRNL